MSDIATHPQLSALIRHRRSIKPVDMDAMRVVGRELLTQVLEDATWAPTHGLTEPWKFIVAGAVRRGLPRPSNGCRPLRHAQKDCGLRRRSCSRQPPKCASQMVPCCALIRSHSLSISRSIHTFG